jgi:hypothetical protein
METLRASPSFAAAHSFAKDANEWGTRPLELDTEVIKERSCLLLGDADALLQRGFEFRFGELRWVHTNKRIGRSGRRRESTEVIRL